MNRQWQMRVGPALISIATTLDLGAALDSVIRRGESVLYELTEATAGSVLRAATITVTSQASAAPSIDIDPGTGAVSIGAIAGAVTAEDLLYLSYLVLESRLHRHGLLTLHAAAVERAGRAIVLLGHPGAGKTITALMLCRDHAFRLIGNDLIVTGGAERTAVVAGTTHLRLRLSSVVANMPELLFLFAPDDHGDQWRAKVDVRPEQLGIAVTDQVPDLGAVVFVRADPAYAALVSATGDTLVHRLNLYENSLRYIRATSTPWLVGPQREFGPYVPSFDSETAHRARTATLNRLMAASHYVAGPAHQVAAYLAQCSPAPT